MGAFFKFPFLIEIKPLLIIFIHGYDIFCFDAEDHNGCLPRNQPSSPCSGSAETTQIVANSILYTGHRFVPFWLRLVVNSRVTTHQSGLGPHRTDGRRNHRMVKKRTRDSKSTSTRIYVVKNPKGRLIIEADRDFHPVFRQ